MEQIAAAMDQWNDGMISNGECLSKILTANISAERRLEYIASVTLVICSQEERAAAHILDKITARRLNLPE